MIVRWRPTGWLAIRRREIKPVQRGIVPSAYVLIRSFLSNRTYQASREGATQSPKAKEGAQYMGKSNPRDINLGNQQGKHDSDVNRIKREPGIITWQTSPCD